jgi:thermolysin
MKRRPIMMRPGIIALLLAGAAAVMTGPAGPRVHAQARRSAVAATTLADLRSWDATVDQMRRDGDLQLRATFDDTLIAGRVHERFEQYYKGVPVIGGDMARQTADRLTVSLFGTIYQGIDLNVEPTLSADQVKALVEERTGVELGASRLPKLVILPDDTGGYRLVYRAVVFTAADGTEFFIDAASGDVVAQYSAAQRQSAVGKGVGVLGDDKKVAASTKVTGSFTSEDFLRPPDIATFDMRSNLNRTIDFLNGVVSLGNADLGRSSDNNWTDGSVVDAHSYAGYTYDYYFKRFGRRGLNNGNLPMTSLVHTVVRDDVLRQPGNVQGTFYLNAFYAGEGVMVYGEGLPPNLTLNGQRWNYLAGALDVCAHELTHGVTSYTSNLIYRNESGALNEAFSDMMGTSAEFFFQPSGTGLMKADYLVGEDVVTPGGLRSMANPLAFGDPDHYAIRYVGTQDNGGVHTNSGVANQAFYLAIEGGTNRTSGLSVVGVGAANREQMEKVFYRGFTQLMPSNATFAVARTVTIQAARDLYGVGSNAERAVTQAWTAVGVN